MAYRQPLRWSIDIQSFPSAFVDGIPISFVKDGGGDSVAAEMFHAKVSRSQGILTTNEGGV